MRHGVADGGAGDAAAAAAVDAERATTAIARFTAISITIPAVMRRIAPVLGDEAAMQGFDAACRHNLVEAPGHRFWRVDDTASQSAVGLRPCAVAACAPRSA
jgi:hypothetical protein